MVHENGVLRSIEVNSRQKKAGYFLPGGTVWCLSWQQPRRRSVEVCSWRRTLQHVQVCSLIQVPVCTPSIALLFPCGHPFRNATCSPSLSIKKLDLTTQPQFREYLARTCLLTTTLCNTFFFVAKFCEETASRASQIWRLQKMTDSRCFSFASHFRRIFVALAFSLANRIVATLISNITVFSTEDTVVNGSLLSAVHVAAVLITHFSFQKDLLRRKKHFTISQTLFFMHCTRLCSYPFFLHRVQPRFWPECQA